MSFARVGQMYRLIELGSSSSESGTFIYLFIYERWLEVGRIPTEEALR